MQSYIYAVLALVAVLAVSHSSALEAGKTLVLLDNNSLKESHSEFFSILKENGFKLKFMSAASSNLALFKFGERVFDNLIIFSPSVEVFGGSLKDTAAFTQFIDDGGNVLMAANDDSSDALREIARECGFELAEAGAQALDHVHSVDSNPALLSANKFIAAEAVVEKGTKSVLYQGSGLALEETNPLAMAILSGSPSSYTHDINDDVTEYPHTVGGSTVLVGALQARNNARFVISGSISLFSNEFFARENFDNRKFASNLALWTFQSRGLLRAVNMSHNRVGESDMPYEYTVMEEVEYGVTIEEKVNGQWVPYNGNDVQLEFVRIDPFVRKTLTNKDGRFHTQFKLPDVYGVFQFKITYQRHGYSSLLLADQVSVRPLLHTQYERFIPSAYPYYASALSMMFGLFFFSIVFLHHRDKHKLD